MQVRFSAQSPPSVGMPIVNQAGPRFSGKFTPEDPHREILRTMAENGSAQAQLDYAMYLYDHAVPRMAKFKVNVLIAVTLGLSALIPPLRTTRNLPNDAIECYKWFYLAKRKQGDIGPNHIESWMKPLSLMMTQEDRNEAIRRAHVWLAEFEPGHRGGSYPDELGKMVERYKAENGLD